MMPDEHSSLPANRTPTTGGLPKSVPAAIVRTSALDLGRRAGRLREQLDLSTSEVARRAGVREEDVVLFEKTGEGSIALLLAVSGEIASGDEHDRWLTIPKFNSLDDVEAYERRRIGAK